MGEMLIDLVMGIAGLLLGAALVSFSAPLAHLMREGDERWLEHSPWTRAFEPQSAWLATDSGRWWILRGWLLGAAVGFVVVGAALLLRAVA